MKNLSKLVTPPSYIDRYIVIRDRKHLATRQVLIDHHAEIAARYDALAARAEAGELELIGASPLLGIRSQLRACYDIETKRLLALKAEIRSSQAKRQLQYCPYCGATTNETHDHYLPAQHFPEFAVNPLNLVPSCFRCNTTKDDDWLSPAGERRYLHFYLDPIPDVIFLHVDLITRPPIVGAGALFRIEQAGMDDPTWGLIRRHFERLHLLELYNESANDEIAEMLQDGWDHLAAGGVDARAFLAQQASSEARIFGRSNWRAVLLRALSAHPELEDWIAAIAP